MRILRHLTPQGPAYAALQPDGSARAIAGDIYGDYRVTDRVVQPGKPLAPVDPVYLPCIGLNYKDHIEEAKLPTPEFPLFFNKQIASVTGPFHPIHLPRVSSKLDFEGELAFVIGRRARHVPYARAREVIAGYLVCDDVSVRDWQFKAPTWTLGKSFDTHCPLGPWLVTPDEVPDPQNLDMWLDVNGERMQSGNTRTMIFGVKKLISYCSHYMTLLPGDVIATGTPPGVGMGKKPDPVWLKPGDVVTLGIQGLGEQQQAIVAYRG